MGWVGFDVILFVITSQKSQIEVGDQQRMPWFTVTAGITPNGCYPRYTVRWIVIRSDELQRR